MYVGEEEWEVVYRDAFDSPDVSYVFLFTALELSALQPWLVRPARESDCKVNDGDSLVKRVVTRSDGRVRSACSFLFLSVSLLCLCTQFCCCALSWHEAHLTVGSSCC